MSFASLKVDKLLIGGRLVDAEDRATYDNINPATETSLGVAADASPRDVEAAVDAARTAFDMTSWSTDPAFRSRCLRQLQTALADHAEEFKALSTAEVGLPAQITGSTVDMPVAGIGWVADLLDRYPFSEDYGEGDIEGFASHRWVEREPYGVVGAITPWNQPFQVNLAKVAPALAAGNTVVLKAAPTTPWSAAAIGRLVAERTDIPPGVFNVITSAANDRGEELVTDPRVDLISFTGSTAVGRRIMSLGSATVKKCFLELGGKSANIVLEDADFARAIGMSTFMVCLHGGQGCATLSRLLLPRSRFEEGVELAAQQLSHMRYGDPTVMGNIMGPLNSARHRDRVEAMVERAIAAGGKPVLGGRRPAHLETGYYFEPTLFADMPEDSEIARDEVFGPVLVALPFDDDDDAVRIANDSVFGLSGAVFSGDHERSKALARRVRAGTMIVDGGIYYGHDVPFGGYKQSGIGRETGKLGFEEYLQVKALCEPI
ncbi:aldehyde dehydrogenase family protein [Actinocorallia longicatena]|uniref:Aldehyde dehydrogenase n=1 Tax=Actinocorallia longicatena TaxID=111803 RepID=A0ABP6QIH0_9ACTN